MNKLYLRLAGTNLKNNKPLYLPYILSGIGTVAMFYMMLFINNNQGLNGIPGSASLKSIMALGVAVIGIFSYIFLFYTNSFIIKRRKKEIGVYNILGMEKRHIAKVLSLETLFVALVSIGGGLLAGILFSRLMLMLLYRILGFQESIVFYITGSGIEISIVLFGVLYLLTLLYNLMQIKLANPIELLHGSSVGEKEPKTKKLMAAAGVVCLGVAYYIAITEEDPIKVLYLFFVAVLLVIIGTYCLFTAGSIVILKALRKNKKFYYNKRHFTAVSGMLYRMKQNAAGLASICVLSTSVLVMVSTTVSMFAGVKDELVARYPMDLCLYSAYDSTDIDTKGLQAQLKGLVTEQGRTIEKESAYAYLSIYASRQGTEFTICGKQNFQTGIALLNVVTRDNLIGMSADFTEENVPQVPQGSVLVYGNHGYGENQMTIAGHTYAVAYAETYVAEQDLYMVSMFEGDYYVVVDSPETLAELYASADGCFYNAMIGVDLDGTKQEKIDCANVVEPVVTDQSDEKIKAIYMESRQANEEEFYAVYGGLFFLGLFLGTMFLMVTVMIIFYKQISEGYDDKERYCIMENVGMSIQEVKASIQSQIRIVFFLPLAAAAVNVAAAFPMIRRLLALLNLTNTRLFILCLAITILIFAMIYYVVFKLTSRAYVKIVKNGK